MAKQNRTNEKTSVVMAKTMAFIKHNIYYILMGICIIALATVITIAAVSNSNKESAPSVNSISPSGGIDNNQNNSAPILDNQEKEQNNNNEQQTISDKFYIISPIESNDVIQTFSNTELVYNNTQRHWATHEGVDFAAKEGSEVKCVYDGVVKSVENNTFYGTSVIITHKDGFESVYKLLEGVNLKVGDKIKKNDKIGVVSKDALAEIKDGPHLHFELLKDGKRVDPMEYLTTGNK